MRLRPIGRAVLIASAPVLSARVVVEPVDAVPGDAAIRRAEQSLRRSSGEPDAGLGDVAGRQPERMIDRAPRARLERGGLCRLLPRSAPIPGTKYSRAEMASARSRED